LPKLYYFILALLLYIADSKLDSLCSLDSKTSVFPNMSLLYLLHVDSFVPTSDTSYLCCTVISLLCHTSEWFCVLGSGHCVLV